MTIHLYDGNNVRLRAMTRPQLGKARPLGLRGAYEEIEMSPDTHVWCWDGYQHNQRRLDIFPGYKVGREPMSEDHFSQIKMFRELLTHSRAVQFDCPGWEADDVIATLARYYASKGQRVVCHTNDLDYLQLEANPNITINGIAESGKPCAPRWVCLYKAMQGDSSDRIPGILGFGPKAWDAVQPYLDQIETGIREEDPSAFEGLPFTPRVRTWLQDPQNISQLKSFLLITHMFTVPQQELTDGMKTGKSDRVAAEALLTRYFL